MNDDFDELVDRVRRLAMQGATLTEIVSVARVENVAPWDGGECFRIVKLMRYAFSFGISEGKTLLATRFCYGTSDSFADDEAELSQLLSQWVKEERRRAASHPAKLPPNETPKREAST